MNYIGNIMLIGLCGKIGAGKSTVAQILEEDGFSIYVLAKPLKQIAMILGFKHEEVFGTQEQKLVPNTYWKISGREFLQRLGTDVFRNTLATKIPNMHLIHGIWIDLFLKFYREQNRPIVVEDVRFPDEVDVIKRLGGHIIHIVRDNSASASNHASEAMDPSTVANFTIYNTGTKEELRREIYNIYKTLGYIRPWRSVLWQVLYKHKLRILLMAILAYKIFRWMN